MSVPVINPGDVATSAIANEWFLPLVGLKSSNQLVTSSTTLVNDADLVIPVAANSTYDIAVQLFFTAASGGDLKWTFTVPSGATFEYQPLHNEGGGTGLTNSTQGNSDSDTVTAAGAGGTIEAVRMTGTLTVLGTGGNLQLRWAQNTSNGTSTTMRAKSYMVARRIA